MSNDYLIVPGSEYKEPEDTTIAQESDFLRIDKALHEIQEHGLEPNARKHLDVPSNKDLKKLEDDLQDLSELFTSIQESNKEYYDSLKEEVQNVENSLDKYARLDQESDFNAPPTINGKTIALADEIKLWLKNYAKSGEVSEKIKEALINYVLVKDVYTTKETLSSKQINDLILEYLENYVSQDDLKHCSFATVGKVNHVMRQHNAELDPHKINTKLTDALKAFYKKGETYSRAETYSRDQINQIIDKLVKSACEGIIDSHLAVNPHLDSRDVRDIIEIYAHSNLINNTQLEEALTEAKRACDQHQPIWKTSGPVLTTVGFVEDNTELPAELTLQQILDQIFYGSKISISADEEAALGERVDVTMCVHIGIPVKSIKLYQNGVVVDEFDLEEFEDGCITRQYGPIDEDTEFTFTVTYTDDEELSESTTVRATWPIFVGKIPIMKAECTLKMGFLNDLISQDPINNEFVNSLPVVHKYDFKDPGLVYLIVGIPISYNKELDYMSNGIQKFGREAFDFHRIGIVKNIKYGVSKECAYDFYTYTQPLSSLNSEVTFNFV